MRLNVKNLAEGPNRFSALGEQEDWLRGIVTELNALIAKDNQRVLSGLALDFEVSKAHPDYYFRGHYRGTVEILCSRCAELFRFPIDYGFEMAFAQVAEKKSKKVELTEEGEKLDVLLFDGHEVDLTQPLHEQLSLSLPFQALCGPNCQGICQQCGQNLNTEGCDCKELKKESPFSVLDQLKT